jgi:preprotein translocase subunit YajC
LNPDTLCYTFAQLNHNIFMSTFILLQAAQPGGSALGMLFPILIFLVFFVFFIYIPQSRQRKQQQQFMDSLKEGMDVVTNAGIIGKITKLDDKTVRLMVDEKTFMRVLRTSVSAEFKG